MNVIHDFSEALRARRLEEENAQLRKDVETLQTLLKNERRRAISAEDRLIYLHREAQRPTNHVG